MKEKKIRLRVSWDKLNKTRCRYKIQQGVSSGHSILAVQNVERLLFHEEALRAAGVTQSCGPALIPILVP